MMIRHALLAVALAASLVAPALADPAVGNGGGIAPASGITSVSAGAPLSSSGGATPSITLASPVSTLLGGTGTTNYSGANIASGTIPLAALASLPLTAATGVDRTSAQTIGGAKTFSAATSFSAAISQNTLSALISAGTLNSASGVASLDTTQASPRLYLDARTGAAGTWRFGLDSYQGSMRFLVTQQGGTEAVGMTLDAGGSLQPGGRLNQTNNAIGAVLTLVGGAASFTFSAGFNSPPIVTCTPEGAGGAVRITAKSTAEFTVTSAVASDTNAVDCGWFGNPN